jgi:hypothetical protein
VQEKAEKLAFCQETPNTNRKTADKDTKRPKAQIRIPFDLSSPLRKLIL